MNSPLLNFVPLRGPHLLIEKVSLAELPSLGEALVAPDTWFSATRRIDTPTRFAEAFTPLVQKQALGQALVLKSSHQGKPVALSVFQFPNDHFSKIEIGFSWVANSWQRTFVNTEMKLLMLSFAFEAMKMSRVEFSVHPTNAKSNRAMERLGAKLEGCLRKWRTNPKNPDDDGDRNIYCVLDEEWPGVKAGLLAKLAQHE